MGVLSAAGAAQTDAELRDTTVKALTLLNEGKFLEAEPELAKLVQWMPDVANLRIMYGTALVFKSKQISDNDEAKKAAALALVQFQEAKRLGSTDPDVDKIITTLGGTVPNGQQNTAKASVFEQAEIKFAQSRYDEALVLYKKALEEDPKNYDAALYSADCLMQLQDYDNAEKYYQKAIAIDPTRETAYRYSATHLMKRVGMSDNYLPELTIGGVKLSIITCTSSTTMLSQDRTLVIILAITMQVILSQSDL